MRAGESGARIAPEPIDTRKRKESRATIDRTLSVMQCPTLLAFFRKAPRLKAAVDCAFSQVPFTVGRVLNPNSDSATAARLQYFRSSTLCSLADLGQGDREFDSHPLRQN